MLLFCKHCYKLVKQEYAHDEEVTTGSLYFPEETHYYRVFVYTYRCLKCDREKREVVRKQLA